MTRAYTTVTCLIDKMESWKGISLNSIADCGLDTELHNVSDSAATLSRVLTSRQNMLLSEIEEVSEKFEDGLS